MPKNLFGIRLSSAILNIRDWLLSGVQVAAPGFIYRSNGPFLADRTNGRAIGTVLRPSSSVRNVLWLTVRPRTKVAIDSLYEVVYEKSIGTKMNDLDLRLEVVSKSCPLLRYIRRWISQKPLEIEAWFQRTTNRKWHMDYQMVTWTMTLRDLERSNSWPQYA